MTDINPAATADGPAAPAAKAKKGAIPEGFVECTITKAGDGQVHTGGAPGETYPRGTVIVVPLETAQSLEARHFVETD